MSLQEKAGQIIQIGVFADDTNLNSPQYSTVRAEIEKYHVGSIDLVARMSGPNLVKGTPLQVATILNQFQRDSKLPLLVGADIERGLASRVAETPEFPFPMAFGAVGDPTVVEGFGAITAKEARAVGIHWAYAPVADVNSNPANPIINTRSFGEDPDQVARLVAAYVRGAHKNGMLVAVKHFPGEGDTSSDPHIRVTRIETDRGHLAKYELPPFVSAIQAGADGIMTAQVAVPALDPDPSKIATTSSKIIDGTLRGELGFKGLVITDALEMRGLSSLYQQDGNAAGRIAVDAVKAGNDVLMLPGNVDAAFNAIVSAVRSGEIPESRIDESVRRILEAKAALGLNQSRYVDLERVKTLFADNAPFDFAQQVSDSAVTLVRNNGKVLPIPSGEQIVQSADATGTAGKLVVVIVADSRYSRLGPAFERELKARRPDAQVFHYYSDHIGTDVSPNELSSAIDRADDVVLAAFITHAAGRQIPTHRTVASLVGFSNGGSELIDDVLKEGLAKTIVIALGSPYFIETHQETQNYICTYSLTPTAEVSAVKAIFGEIQNHAKLPVTLPGVAARGAAEPWPVKSPGAGSIAAAR